KNASNDEPQPSSDAGKKDDEGVCKESAIVDQERPENSTQGVNTVGPSINVEPDMFSLGDNATLEATHANFFGDETKVDMSNITTTYPVPSTPNTRIHKDHSLDPVIGDVQSGNLQLVSTVKLHVLKKGEYTFWSMKMEQYLTNTDYSLWQVILNGDGPIQVTTDENGVETEVPLKTAQALLQRKRKRKAKSILLLAILDEYQLRFHGIKDVKTLWAAIKSIFGAAKQRQKETTTYKNSSQEQDDYLPKAYGKRAGEKKSEESAKKQKLEDVVEEQESAKSDEEAAADYEHGKEELRMWLIVVSDEKMTARFGRIATELVKEKLKTLLQGYNLLLWGDLKLQHVSKEKVSSYQEILQKIVLNWKLEAEAESTMTFELLKFIKSQLEE
ncbi:hypothetical protein Tco_1036636, partial [Tanacetum coccineum]